MKYAEAIQYMFDALPMFHRQGTTAYKKDLTNIQKLCEALGNPHKQFKCIHIAGTNGKGSVSHMLSAVLQTHDFKTGLYISPHYIDFRERIKINGQYIPRSYVSRFIEANKELLEIIKPSFFEMTVALAFKYFADQKVDLAVIETGLGGRLDSTNIINPILSIITNISWDHSDMLGDTLEKIAFEKAGIIKSNTPVLIGRNQEECLPVFHKKAIEMDSELFLAEKVIPDFETTFDAFGLKEIITTLNGKTYDIRPQLKGIYQAENIRLVCAAVKILHDIKLFEINQEAIRKAFEQVTSLTRIMGRWQIVSMKPLLVCESAHNEDGIKFLEKQLQNMSYHKLHIVCGFVKEKDLSKVFPYFPKHARYYFVKAKIPRALDADVLKEKANAYQLHGNVYATVRRGLSQALKSAGPEDLILVTGSVFVVAEVLEKYHGRVRNQL